MSVEEEVEIFDIKRKFKIMEQELRTFVNMSHGSDRWNQVLRIQERDIRKKRKEVNS